MKKETGKTNKSNVKASKTPKSKLDKLIKTDGEYIIDPPAEPPKARNMDEIFGAKKVRYIHSDADDYRVWLESLNTIDIQDHAVELGEFANGERNRLINRLIGAFNVYQSMSAKVENSYRQSKTNPKISPEVAKILAQGR